MPPATFPSPAKRRSWREAWLIYLEPASLRMLTLGFSAGLPLLLVLGTLIAAWPHSTRRKTETVPSVAYATGD